MNQNQKVSIFENPALRKEIALRIADAINQNPKIIDKITEEDVEKIVNDQDMANNFQKLDFINQQVNKLKDMQNNNSQIMSQNPDTNGTRWGYCLYNLGNSDEDKIKNREIDIYTQNVEMRKKLINNLIMDELNVDLKLKFPKSESEAINQYLDNIKLIEIGFLFTDIDLLANLKNTNPVLHNICDKNKILFQDNYTRYVIGSYSTILKVLVPSDKFDPHQALYSDSAREIVNILNSYVGKIKELDDYSKLEDKDRIEYVAESLNYINQFSQLGKPEYNKSSMVAQILYDQKIIQNGMFLNKVFKKDGKVISFSEVVNNFNLETKTLNPKITTETINETDNLKMIKQISLEEVNADTLYYKHILYELENKEYAGSYSRLQSFIKQYLNLVEKEKEKAQENSKMHKDVTADEYLAECIHALKISLNFHNLDGVIKNDIKTFTIDLLKTNKKHQEMDKKIKELNQFNKILENSVNSHKNTITMHNYDDYLENAKLFNDKIKEIENRRIEMALIGDKTSIKKANEYYYKAYEEILNSGIVDRIKNAQSSYNNDYTLFRNFFAGIGDYTFDNIIKNMRFYITLENQKNEIKTEFEKERLNQMIEFCDKYEKEDPNNFKELRKNREFEKELKLASRIPCEYNVELNKKKSIYNSNITCIESFKKFIDNIQTNQYKEDYSAYIEKINIFINGVNTIEEECKDITNLAEKDYVKTNKLYEFLKTDNLNSFLNDIRKDFQDYEDQKDTFDKEIEEFNNETKAFNKETTKNKEGITLDEEVDTFVNKNNYKETNRFVIDTMNFFKTPKEKTESLIKLEKLMKQYPNDTDIKDIKDHFYEINNSDYLQQSLKALSILNLKHEEYENRGFITKWWYKKTHNKMLETRDNLINQLQSNGVLLKNLETVGLGDNSFVRNYLKEIHLESIKEDETTPIINAFYKEYFKDNNSELQNKLQKQTETNKTMTKLQEEYKKNNDFTNEMKKTATNNKK